MSKAVNIYTDHFLLDEKTIIDFVKDNLDYFDRDASLHAKEIGDGNINYVFRVWDEKTGRSLVIKQADKKLKSSGRPLGVYRNKIEAEILKLQNSFAPGKVPHIYHYNESMCALTMEDISDFKNLRTALLEGNIYEDLSREITDFMVQVLLSTTDLLMDRHMKKEFVKKFINVELCDISEDLVFTEPYFNYKDRNVITAGNEDFVNAVLYGDEGLKKEVGVLRNTFMNASQALIHGDLHSGSIFINETGIKVIDPEFAFYGPIGYDVGNVIGNLFFSLANKLVTAPDHTEFISWIERTISEIFDCFKEKAVHKLTTEIEFPLYNDGFINGYVAGIMSDTVGMAGTEIIRRVVGDTKVKDLILIKEGKEKIKIERALILTAVSFIKNRKTYTCGMELIDEFRRCKESVNV
ncbi:MAG: S-methyl-5-thioribose kinase [Erysipelotrichaceae bacterium]|nr:S-methyl-5-thioribose kinase [Erysipelotrichaceae bacterium]